jgi:hypothetical protein
MHRLDRYNPTVGKDSKSVEKALSETLHAFPSPSLVSHSTVVPHGDHGSSCAASRRIAPCLLLERVLCGNVEVFWKQRGSSSSWSDCVSGSRAWRQLLIAGVC